MHRALLLPLALLIGLPLFAAERVALVIGNDAYQHARPLNAAVNDATAIAGALEHLNFEVVRATNAGLDEMMEAMESVKEKAVGSDAVLVFYAGHGVESGGVNYLVPVDAVLEREIHLKKQTLSLDEILADLKTLNVPARMVILDCCRDNPIEGRSWLATRSAGGGGLAALSQDTLSEATLVVYAASPGKPALDRVGNTDAHSPFTAALLAELPKPGAHSFEMFGKVEDTVIESTEGRQAPRLFYNGSTQPFRNFFFATSIPVPAQQAAPPAPAQASFPQLAAPAPVMFQETPPPTPSLPTLADTPPTPSITLALPSRGYFTSDELFATGPYAAYNSYSQSRILKQAQEKLKALGLYTGTPDGVSGPGTQRALITFQKTDDLPITGRLDATSLEKLSLTAISQMTAPAPVQRPPSSRPPSKPSSGGGQTSLEQRALNLLR